MTGARDFIKYVYEHTENAPNHFPKKCPKCPKCESDDVQVIERYPDSLHCICQRCGWSWWT